MSENFEHFKLEKKGDEIRISDGKVMIMKPKEQIQEIANKPSMQKNNFTE